MVYNTIMGLLRRSKSRQTVRKEPHNGTPNERMLNAICRQMRLINERLATNEGAISTLRRDVNRIDRKGYRAAEREVPASPASDEQLQAYLKSRGLA